MPTSGVDPDGDLAFVGGIVGEDGQAVDLRLGRVLGFGAATIRYEAYPRSAGTEVIRYQLRDRFGLTSEGFIRVGVVQPGDPQPPVAVEDDIVAAPGRTVHADVLANDLIAAGDSVTFEDFDKLNDADVLKEFQRQKDDSFKVVAPRRTRPRSSPTASPTASSTPSRSTLTVRGQKDFNNPPIAVDDTGMAKQGETSILVDALANDRDLDGDQASLTITKFIGDGVTRRGPQAAHPAAAPGARRALRHRGRRRRRRRWPSSTCRPAATGCPTSSTARPSRWAPTRPSRSSLADYVSDPRGGKVAVTSPDTVSTSPADNLQSEVTSATELSLTSTNGYVGPAALMLEVTNSTGPGDKAAQTAYVTIPVQIGPDVPVLRCPDHEVLLAPTARPAPSTSRGSARRGCPTGLDAGHRAVRGVVGPGRRPRRPDASRARAAARSSSRPSPPPRPARPAPSRSRPRAAPSRFKIKVRVTSSPPARDPAAGAHRGPHRRHEPHRQPRAVPRQSRSTAPQCAISRSASGVGHGRHAVSQTGCQLTVTATDSRSRRRPRRGATVIDAPGRRAAARRGHRHRAQQARRRWRPRRRSPTGSSAAARGSTSDRRPTTAACRSSGYEVDGQRPRRRPQGLPVVPVHHHGPDQRRGLHVHRPQPQRRRLVGPESRRATRRGPDTKPKATAISHVTPGDRRLTVAWTPPPNEGSEVLKYRVQWTNIGGSAGAGGIQAVPAPTTDQGRHRPRQQRRLQGARPGQERGRLGSLRSRGQGPVLRQAGRRACADPQPARARAR